MDVVMGEWETADLESLERKVRVWGSAKQGPHIEPHDDVMYSSCRLSRSVWAALDCIVLVYMQQV